MRHPQYSVLASHGTPWTGRHRGTQHQFDGSGQGHRAASFADILAKSCLRAVDIAGTQVAFQLTLDRYPRLDKNGPNLPKAQNLEPQLTHRLCARSNQIDYRDALGRDWQSSIQEDVGDVGHQTRSKTCVDDLLL
jgi:hypothetical protein